MVTSVNITSVFIPPQKKLFDLIERVFPTAFLTTYDVKTGVEMFETQDRGILKLLSKLLNVFSLTVLSSRCFHTWGGARLMLRELHAGMKPGDFVYKTDIYSYSASLNQKDSGLCSCISIVGEPGRMLVFLSKFIPSMLLLSLLLIKLHHQVTMEIHRE